VCDRLLSLLSFDDDFLPVTATTLVTNRCLAPFNPFNASRSELLLFEGFSGILV